MTGKQVNDQDAHELSSGPNDDDVPSDNGASDGFQEGVQRVRAITSSWSKTTLWVMFVL